MRREPPKILERIVAALTPAAVREHVVGDLHERYRSPGQYIAEALRTIPMVVLSRVLRCTNPQQFLMEAAALFAAYVGGVWMAERSAFFSQPDALALCVGWSLLALVILAVRDAYASEERRQALLTVFDAAALALVFNLLIQRLQPAIALPMKGAAAAAVWTVILVAVARLAFMVRTSGQPAAGSLEEIPARAAKFEKRIRARNLRETLAAVAVVVMLAVGLVRRQIAVQNPGFLLLAAAMVFIMVYLHRYGSPRAVPGSADPLALLRFYRAEVTRQRDLLRRIWWWYLGPMVPGLAVIVIQSAMAHPDRWQTPAIQFLFMTLGMIGVGMLNRYGARKLQREIDALEALERGAQ